MTWSFPSSDLRCHLQFLICWPKSLFLRGQRSLPFQAHLLIHGPELLTCSCQWVLVAQRPGEISWSWSRWLTNSIQLPSSGPRRSTVGPWSWLSSRGCPDVAVLRRCLHPACSGFCFVGAGAPGQAWGRCDARWPGSQGFSRGGRQPTLLKVPLSSSMALTSSPASSWSVC